MRKQQVIARYGKSARYPVCLSAIGVWQSRAELAKWMKREVSDEQVLSRTKLLKEWAEAAIEQLRKEQKEKEVSLWTKQLREIEKLLTKAQKCYEESVRVRLFYQDSHQWAADIFNQERAVVARTNDTNALQALQRVQKRWNNRKAFVKDSDRRTLEILEMLRDTASDKVAAKKGPNARYLEAAQSGDRMLSDKAWQGLLTAKEIQSRLVDAPVDMDAKEVRRLVKKLGVRLARDKRGRRLKPPLPKQKTERPYGLPRTTPWEEFISGTALAGSELSSRGPKDKKLPKNQFWDSTQARRTAAQKKTAGHKNKAATR